MARSQPPAVPACPCSLQGGFSCPIPGRCVIPTPPRPGGSGAPGWHLEAGWDGAHQHRQGCPEELTKHPAPCLGHLPWGQPCGRDLGEVTRSWSTVLLPATAFLLVTDGTAQHSCPPTATPQQCPLPSPTVAEGTGCPGQVSPALREPGAAIRCPNHSTRDVPSPWALPPQGGTELTSSGPSLPGHFPLIPGSPLPCCQSPGQGGSEQGQVLSPTSPHSAELLLLPGELSPRHVHTAQLERDKLFQLARCMGLRQHSPPSPSSGFICPPEVPGVYRHTRDKDKTKSS